MSTSKKIGIVGSGIVGQVLATSFLAEGYEVMLGSRDASKEELVKWKEANTNGMIGTFADTANFAGVIVLATKGSVVLNAIELAGKNNFDHKVVIDATNPIADAPPVNGVLQFFTTPNSSLMEEIQASIPRAYVVKAFNSIGNGVMYKPSYSGGKPTMFICGNSADAKQTVTKILDAFGWETEDMGMVESARAIEPLCQLWCILGFTKNQWSHAFKLLK